MRFRGCGGDGLMAENDLEASCLRATAASDMAGDVRDYDQIDAQTI